MILLMYIVDNFGMALETTVQVKTCLYLETYNVCNIARGKRQGEVDHITLANKWQISLEKERTQNDML